MEWRILQRSQIGHSAGFFNALWQQVPIHARSIHLQTAHPIVIDPPKQKQKKIEIFIFGFHVLVFLSLSLKPFNPTPPLSTQTGLVQGVYHTHREPVSAPRTAHGVFQDHGESSPYVHLLWGPMSGCLSTQDRSSFAVRQLLEDGGLSVVKGPHWTDTAKIR